MRDYAKFAGLLDADAPPTWVDADGKVWRTLRGRSRLKFRTAGPVALKRFVFERDGYACRYCGLSLPHGVDIQTYSVGGTYVRVGLVMDHVISRRNGGSHHPDNMVTACESCNAAKASLVDARATP